MVAGASPADKRFATLAAKFALLGHALVRVQAAQHNQAPYVAMRWGMLRPLADLDAAAAFLRQVGGQP